MFTACFDGLQFRLHLFTERRQCIGLNAMLAGQGANLEKASLRGLQPCRVERQCIRGAGDFVFGLACLDRWFEVSLTFSPRRVNR